MSPAFCFPRQLEVVGELKAGGKLSPGVLTHPHGEEIPTSTGFGSFFKPGEGAGSLHKASINPRSDGEL